VTCLDNFDEFDELIRYMLIVYCFIFTFCYSFAMAQLMPRSTNMDDSVSFCHKCSGHIVSDSIASSRMIGKETVMLYDMETAQKVLSGATLIDLPHLNLSLEPVSCQGKINRVSWQ